MKDYEAIVYAPHLGITERSQMVSDAFNQSAANAGDYNAFKSGVDKRANAAISKLIAHDLSPLGDGIRIITNMIGVSGGSMPAGVVDSYKEQFEALRTMHAKEQVEIERLKPEVESLSKLFGILAHAEENMDGFDETRQKSTHATHLHLVSYSGSVASSEVTARLQKSTLDGLEELLNLMEADNTAAAQKTAFADYLKTRPAVAAPLPAPATAKFKKKTP